MAYEIIEPNEGRYEILGDAPASVRAGVGINSIPRQLGLTARYGIEGLGNAAQVLTEPLRYITDRLTGQTGKTRPVGQLATQAADALGLPSPQGANERVIADATRLLAGAGGMGGAANAASALPGAVGRVGAFLGVNPMQQVSSAVGAGLAGGASREAGGGEVMQGVAALLGGVGGGLAPGVANSVASAGRSMLNRNTPPQKLDAQIRLILERSGADYSDLPARAMQTMRTELRSALQAGKELDPAAVRRLADFARTNTIPTRGMVSQNPVQITREQNLAKMAANSSDEGLYGLPLIQNRNNATLINNLNEAGAARGNVEQAGELVTQAVTGRQAGLRAAETGAWNTARNSPGYRQPIEANVISDINRSLGDEGLMPFMNPTISRYMEAFQTGQPFTPQAYRNLQSMLSNEMNAGGNPAAAAGLARRVLERAELRPITNPMGVDFGNAPVTAPMAAQLRDFDAQPAQAIDAVNRARAATRAAYSYEDSSPLVRNILSGGATSDPARIARRFVVGGTNNEAEVLAREVGEAGRGPIRDAIVAHLKDKALNGAADEVGKFSQSAFNKALNAIGERKLSLFFSPDEISNLRANARVASYMQNQPIGSAVNNSNSGALMLGRGYDVARAVASKIPFGQQAIVDPLRNIDISLSQRAAQNIRPGLLAHVQRPPFSQGMVLPALGYGGGLLSPSP